MPRISLLSLLFLTASFPVLVAHAEQNTITPADMLKARLEAARNEAAGKAPIEEKVAVPAIVKPAPVSTPVKAAVKEQVKIVAPQVAAKAEPQKVLPAPVIPTSKAVAEPVVTKTLAQIHSDEMAGMKVVPADATPASMIKNTAPAKPVVAQVPAMAPVIAPVKAPVAPTPVPANVANKNNPSPLDDLMNPKAAVKTPAPKIVTPIAPKVADAPAAKTVAAPVIEKAQTETVKAPTTVATSKTVIAPAMPAPKALPPVDDKLPLPQVVAASQPRVMSIENNRQQVPIAAPTADPSKAPVINRSAAPQARILPPMIKKTQGFIPAPAAAKGIWTVRTIHADNKNPDGTFCLMENRFDNDVSLMLGQRADGYSTLGLNYGIEMLQPNQNYIVTVQVDDSFEENFMAYAESQQTLVVQLGKKRSFFDTLPYAQAIRVAMQGSASTFTATGLAKSMDKMSQCLSSIGGQALHAVDPNMMPAVPVAPVAMVDTLAPPVAPVITPAPVVEKVQPIARSVAVPSPIATPVAPEAMPKPIQPPVIAEKKMVPPPAPVMPAPVVNKPVAAAPAVKPVAAPVAPPVVKKAESKPDLMNVVSTTLRQAGLKTQNLHKAGDQIAWTDNSQKLAARALNVAKKDILDASDSVIADAEKSCAGQFSVQQGVPEDFGATSTQVMESKCVTKNRTTVSAWLMQQKNGQTVAWEMQAPAQDRELAFDARTQLVESIKKSSN